jgi:putative transposase
VPRSLRILPAHCVAHALNRGNDKKALFDVAEDFEDFLELVRVAKAKCTIRILAYCLMLNHWHFILWPRTGDDVSNFFEVLETTHAKRRRWQTGTIGYGHVYQDRYKAFVINHDRYYYTAMSYVEGNAMRAGLVTRSQDWRWSSLYERRLNPRGILDEGPLPLPHDWSDLVDEGLSNTVVDDIRGLIRKH